MAVLLDFNYVTGKAWYCTDEFDEHGDDHSDCKWIYEGMSEPPYLSDEQDAHYQDMLRDAREGLDAYKNTDYNFGNVWTSDHWM